MPLYVRATPDKGSGVYAGTNFPTGSEVLRFGGPLLLPSDVPHPLRAEEDHYLQVDVRTYLGPSGEIDDLVNHSCDPNCKVVIEEGVVSLLALREIKKDTEITFDYSTTSTEDPSRWCLECSCGSIQCRRLISGFHTLPLVTQQDYIRREMVPMFILDHFVPYWLGLN